MYSWSSLCGHLPWSHCCFACLPTMEASTAGVAEAYPFCDAFVVDESDATALGRPTVTTDIAIEDEDDSARVARAVRDALALVEEGS